MKNPFFNFSIFSLFIVACSPQKSTQNIENETINVVEKPITKSQTCAEVVIEILSSSAVYKQKTNGLAEKIIQNGGTSYGITIEGSPYPKRDDAAEYSINYDFNLHETYPDRAPVIARFSFNPTERQLYEYDVVEDLLKPIDFDKTLLAKFDSICL